MGQRLPSTTYPVHMVEQSSSAVDHRPRNRCMRRELSKAMDPNCTFRSLSPAGVRRFEEDNAEIIPRSHTEKQSFSFQQPSSSVSCQKPNRDSSSPQRRLSYVDVARNAASGDSVSQNRKCGASSPGSTSLSAGTQKNADCSAGSPKTTQEPNDLGVTSLPGRTRHTSTKSSWPSASSRRLPSSAFSDEKDVLRTDTVTPYVSQGTQTSPELWSSSPVKNCSQKIQESFSAVTGILTATGRALDKVLARICTPCESIRNVHDYEEPPGCLTPVVSSGPIRQRWFSDSVGGQGRYRQFESRPPHFASPKRLSWDMTFGQLSEREASDERRRPYRSAHEQGETFKPTWRRKANGEESKNGRNPCFSDMEEDHGYSISDEDDGLSYESDVHFDTSSSESSCASTCTKQRIQVRSEVDLGKKEVKNMVDAPGFPFQEENTKAAGTTPSARHHQGPQIIDAIKKSAETYRQKIQETVARDKLYDAGNAKTSTPSQLSEKYRSDASGYEETEELGVWGRRPDEHINDYIKRLTQECNRRYKETQDSRLASGEVSTGNHSLDEADTCPMSILFNTLETVAVNHNDAHNCKVGSTTNIPRGVGFCHLAASSESPNLKQAEVQRRHSDVG